MYKCFTILSFLLIFCHRFVSNYENFDTKLLINHAHRAREREKKIQNKLFILKERDYKKIYKPTISLEEIEVTLTQQLRFKCICV